jgi:DNA mismatch endonuclease (patch repair protein)
MRYTQPSFGANYAGQMKLCAAERILTVLCDASVNSDFRRTRSDPFFAPNPARIAYVIFIQCRLARPLRHKTMEGHTVDNVTKEIRSKIMRSVKSRNTRPELCVRRLVHSLGYRYRIADSRLPGKPDLVFRRRKKVIFVHGCFWHVHKGCGISHIPKYTYWRTKLDKNAKRDSLNLSALKRSGWKSLVLWECELPAVGRLRRRITSFLGPTHA